MAGLEIPGEYDFAALDRIKGMHCDWRQLLRRSSADLHPLTAFTDAERHFELAGMNVQNVKVIHRLRREGARAFAHA